jgi:hypothetical protein
MQRNVAQPVKSGVAQLATAVSNGVKSAAAAVQHTAQQAKQFVQAKAQALAAAVNKQFCTTAERIKEVDWKTVGKVALNVGMIALGGVAVATGVGAVVGIPLIVAGAADIAFMVADTQEELTGNNYIKDNIPVFKENELLYAGVSIGVGIASPSPFSKAKAGGKAVNLAIKHGDSLAGAAKNTAKAADGATGGGWNMQKGGEIIDGRKYTEHALERMAPNTAEVQAELHTRAMERANIAGIKPGTEEYNIFINKQVNPRNVPPMVVDDAIRNTPALSGKSPDTYVHQALDVDVIVNKTGDVITVVPK